MWEAIYGLMENQGLKLAHYEVPIQDKLAGHALAATEKYMAENPETVGRFCRAVAKGLHFALTDPKAAVKLFYDEFPSTKPAGKDDATVVEEGVGRPPPSPRQSCCASRSFQGQPKHTSKLLRRRRTKKARNSFTGIRRPSPAPRSRPGDHLSATFTVLWKTQH
jgi:hypothetical protein